MIGQFIKILTKRAIKIHASNTVNLGNNKANHWFANNGVDGIIKHFNKTKQKGDITWILYNSVHGSLHACLWKYALHFNCMMVGQTC